MICARCGTDNPPGRKFCGACGARLALLCPVCGAANWLDRVDRAIESASGPSPVASAAPQTRP